MPRPVGGPAESPGFRVSSLTTEQRREYESQGFLLLPALFSPEELASWHARFLDIVEERVAPADSMVVMRDVMVAKGLVGPRSKPEAIAKIQDFHNDAPLFEGYCKNPKLLAVVEDVQRQVAALPRKYFSYERLSSLERAEKGDTHQQA